MLKRFMNWLLHRLQQLLGVLGGKHRGQSRGGQSRSNVASQSPFVLERQPNQPPPLDASRELAAELDKSLLDSPSSNELSASNQPVNLQKSDDAVVAKILDPTLAEPDTHRRLNASSAALPGTAPQVPSFPTEVSELISSSPAQAVTASAEPEQLPAIHDLLPAIEPDEFEDNSPAPSVPQAILCSFDITESDVNSASEDAVPTVEPLAASETIAADSLLEAKRESVTSPQISVSESSESSVFIPEVVSPTVEEAVTEEQAIKDTEEQVIKDTEEQVITDTEEQASDIDEEIPVADSTAEMPSIELDRSMEEQSLFVEEEEEIPLEIELEGPTAATDLTAPLADEPSASDLLPAVENEPIELVREELQESADIVTSQVAGLPYPWSLAASNKATKTNAEDHAESSAVVRNQDSLENGGSEDTDELLLESETDRPTSVSLVSTEAQSEASSGIEVSSGIDDTSFKNGVVKLLFTLKPGNFHGYIVPDDGTQDILFHQKYINADAFEQLSRGAKVVVTVKYIEGKAYAKQVDLLSVD